MQKATDDYITANAGFNTVCEKYSVPKPTFQRYLKGKVKRYLDSSKALNGREAALVLKHYNLIKLKQTFISQTSSSNFKHLLYQFSILYVWHIFLKCSYRNAVIRVLTTQHCSIVLLSSSFLVRNYYGERRIHQPLI
jgi:hypothetical protein